MAGRASQGLPLYDITGLFMGPVTVPAFREFRGKFSGTGSFQRQPEGLQSVLDSQLCFGPITHFTLGNTGNFYVLPGQGKTSGYYLSIMVF